MWDDDLTLASVPRRRGTLQLAMYAWHLGSGNSLKCKSIKVDTIKKYILDVARFLALFGPRDIDYRKDNNAEKSFSRVLQSVYDELERWETVPNRREPFTIEMLDALLIKVEKLPPGHHTGLLAVLYDWFVCGLFGGFRLSEWAQPGSQSDPSKPQLNIFDDTEAFVLNDVSARSRSGARLTGAAVISVPVAELVEMRLTWRTQKNGDNGEKKLFAANPKGRSFIPAMYRIIERFVRLCSPTDNSTPLVHLLAHRPYRGRPIGFVRPY